MPIDMQNGRIYAVRARRLDVNAVFSSKLRRQNLMPILGKDYSAAIK